MLTISKWAHRSREWHPCTERLRERDAEFLSLCWNGKSVRFNDAWGGRFNLIHIHSMPFRFLYNLFAKVEANPDA